jgi:hypothetical protein
MMPFYRFLHGLFTTPLPPVTDVQTALEPIHEENATLGSEFLDDFASLNEENENEPK